MTLKEIREEAWEIARDVALVDQDRLWPSREMNKYINRAYKQIARDTKCIKDSITPSVCRISVAPPADLADLTSKATSDSFYAQDLAWYNDSNSLLYGQLVTPYSLPLSDKILKIVEAKWTNVMWKLVKVSVQKWQVSPIWEQVIGSFATEYATDLDSKRIALNYRTASSDTLKLVVRRMPLANLVNDADTPEFPEDYHYAFLNGVLWQMFSKTDAETLNKVKADEYHAKFLVDIDTVKKEEELLDTRLNVHSAMGAFR